METSNPPQDFSTDHDIASKRLNELMVEYLNIKKIERDNIIGDLHSEVRKRVYALKKLQLDTIKLDAEFHREVFNLEQKFQCKHDEVYKKQMKIVNGLYQPSEEECKVSGIEIPPSNSENDSEPPTGIPHFWFYVLKNVNELKPMIKDQDEKILKHLVDVRANSKSIPNLSFELEFHFEPNKFFKNSVLTKTYLMKCCPDPDDPFSFEGPEIFKTTGCEILWNPGMNVTENSEYPSALSFFKADSFFNFFNPPEMKAGDSSEAEQIETYLESDFEVGHYLKDRVIPRAVLFFLGEIDDSEMDDDSITFNPDVGDYEVGDGETNVGDN